MTFLFPTALGIAAAAAAGLVLLHLVARHRPAAYFLPTTRFVPDQRTLVSRAAMRPRDLLLLALRVLLILTAGAAFAKPVLTPAEGRVARLVLLDRSNAVADPRDALARARAAAGDAEAVVIAFDTSATVLLAPHWDSLSAAPPSGAPGSISAALVAARRAAIGLAESADSVQLTLVSPVVESAIDSATRSLRALWPGSIRLERVAPRVGGDSTWRLDRALSVDDPLGPACIRCRPERSEGPDSAAVKSRSLAALGTTVRLTRAPLTPDDSTFARAGGTVVRWDNGVARDIGAEGLSVGDEVIVAAVTRVGRPIQGRTIARWADGAPAAVERRVGSGCVRDVVVGVPPAGDLALHAPFQRIARTLMTPCGVTLSGRPLDAAGVIALAGSGRAAAPASLLRSSEHRVSSLAKWLLVVAIALGIAELIIRARPVPEDA